MLIVLVIPPNNAAKIPNKNSPIPKMNKVAPIMVKSVLVVKAYNVRANVIPKVIVAAIITNCESDVEQANETYY